MPRKLLAAVINVYQKYFRIFLPSSCRFVPSCSEYAKEAVAKYGAFRGIWIGLKRVVKCNPYSGKSGYDPVP